MNKDVSELISELNGEHPIPPISPAGAITRSVSDTPVSGVLPVVHNAFTKKFKQPFMVGIGEGGEPVVNGNFIHWMEDTHGLPFSVQLEKLRELHCGFDAPTLFLAYVKHGFTKEKAIVRMRAGFMDSNLCIKEQEFVEWKNLWNTIEEKLREIVVDDPVKQAFNANKL